MMDRTDNPPAQGVEPVPNQPLWGEIREMTEVFLKGWQR
jgi:hypothetical protein